MIDTWEHLSSLMEVTAIATEMADREQRDALQEGVAFRRQLAAAVRWVQTYHGDEVGASFVTYLGDAASRRAEGG